MLLLVRDKTILVYNKVIVFILPSDRRNRPRNQWTKLLSALLIEEKQGMRYTKRDITQYLKLQRILMFITVLLVDQFVHFARYND
jgi:hypothetical protein